MTLLEAVKEARAERRTLPGGRDWGVGLEEAYRIQEALFPGPLKGYKLGLVSEAKQRQMGIAEPVFGRVHPGMLLERVVLEAFLQPRLEPEVAVVLKEDLPPGPPWGRPTGRWGGTSSPWTCWTRCGRATASPSPRWWRTTPPGAASSWGGGASPGFPREASGPT
ncbi:hypothetical protein [Thermus scotoductus]|uniref:hypothetical protein n=1 Tax=Thermus scotoductus TaxID=37636 RepID=UPI000A98DD70|nr:hypothetical protein [Thermus scotoductus]